LKPLHRLLHISDEEILSDTCWAISYFSDGENECIQAVVEAGLVPRLIKSMKSNDRRIVTPSLRAVGNIVSGTKEQTQAALNMGCLDVVLHIMENTHDTGIMKECCWTISNITAGTVSQIQEVLNNSAIFLLRQWMKEKTFEVKKEIAWIVTNAISGGTDSQIRHLIDLGFLRILVDFLTSQDCELIISCLQAIDSILEVGDKISSDENPYSVMIESCGGLDIIEALQNHSQKEIYEICTSILDKYFEEID
jgi:hypothetical protein